MPDFKVKIDGTVYNIKKVDNAEAAVKAAQEIAASLKQEGATDPVPAEHLLATGKTTPKMSTADRVLDYLNLGLHGATGGVSDEWAGLVEGVREAGPLNLARDAGKAAMRSPLNAWSQFKESPSMQDYLPAYAEGRDTMRDYMDAARDRTGMAGTGAEIAGSFVPVGKAAQVGSKAVTGASPFMRSITGAFSGASAGGAAGFAEGEGGFGPRVRNAALPAVFGGVLGGAGPTIGAGVGRLAEGIQRRRAARIGQVPPNTVDVLKHAFKMDIPKGAPTPRVDMIADTGGTSTALLAKGMERVGGKIDDVAIRTPKAFSRPVGVPTEATIRRRLTERTARETDRFKRGLDLTMGAPKGLRATEDELFEAARPRVNAAYEQAYATPIDYASEAGMELEALLKSKRIPARAWREANELMDEEGSESAQILFKIGDDGRVTLERLPDVRQIDYLKRALDDMIEAERTPKGKLTDKGRVRYKTSKDMLELIDGLVPSYGQARELYAIPAGQVGAMETGYKALISDTMTADKFAAEVKRMTPDQRDWLKSGARSAIEEVMQKVRAALVPNPTRTGYLSVKSVGDDDVQAALKALSSGRARDKLRLILGDEDADELFGIIDGTMTAYMTEAATLPNKMRQAQELLERFAPSERTDMASRLLRGEFLGAAQDAAGAAMGRAMKDDRFIAGATQADMVNVLTSPLDTVRVDALRGVEFPEDVGRQARGATEAAMKRAGIPVGMAMGDNDNQERLLRYLLGY
ncbi:MAG: hypothetical protein F4145_16680 [Boseongicola sp. SB0675_bin_26]|nr:hypothetical protein [Boseongicola sp. SB0665_bin_10]MYH59574.1 hypothetical protein [Boseongicola sp. SB0675_bin_26]